jgi:hypothetical protein
MIKRLSTILPALAFVLPVHTALAQAPTPSKPQSQPPAQSKPQPAKPRQESESGVLYKSTMPDGKVIYGDAPMPGATKVEKSRPDTSKKGITAATPKEKEALRKLEAERAASASAAPAAGPRKDKITMDELDARLRQMEAEREKAKEPLPGERIGTASGGSRFTDAYWERQKRLDHSLDSVRKEIDKARAAAASAR